MASETPTPAWKKFLAQLADPLVILLLVATAISAGLWLLERAALPYEAIAILAVVVINALIAYVQERRAEQAVAVDAVDWFFCAAIASSVLWLRELGKLGRR